MTEGDVAEQRIIEEQQDRHMVHVHTFSAITFVADEHQHTITGVTAPARRTGQSHFHRIQVRTSFFSTEETGHWHWVDLMTGPASDAIDGSHIHSCSGITSLDDAHAHSLVSVTGLAPDLDGDSEPLLSVANKPQMKYRD